MLQKSLPLLLFALLLVAACRQPAQSIPPRAVELATAPTLSATPAGTPTNTPTPPPLAPPPTITPPPTAVVHTPTPTLTRPPVIELEQPPYAESDCSDKYPCSDDVAAWETRIRAQPGFKVSYFTRLPGNPTRITFGPDGRLYAALLGGQILRVSPSGEIETVLEGLLAPTALAFRPGTNQLYISNRISNAYVGGEAEILVFEDGQTRQLIRGLPCCYVGMHAANDIAFGPDGYGYVSIGARADHGEIISDGPDAGMEDELHPLEASILRFDPDNGDLMVYARGFRNAYGIAWDADGRLFATDNGPDDPRMAGQFPDLLHRVIPGAQHGYPWYDCDFCFTPPAGTEIVSPLYEFPVHSAVTGINAYLHDHFPGYYNSLFVILWSALPEAQRLIHFTPGGSEATTFATGFAQPIDLAIGPDGALYLTDYATGIVFKITYEE
jgi:glucose/arabinose dehydrogenase